MIAELKAQRRDVVKQIGELQKRRQYLDIQIAVVSAERRVQVSEFKRRKIYPLIAECLANGKDFKQTASFLNCRGFRNKDKMWRGTSVQALYEVAYGKR